LFGSDVDAFLNGKLVGKIEGGKDDGIQINKLKLAHLYSGINNLNLKFSKSSGVNYLGVISFY